MASLRPGARLMTIYLYGTSLLQHMNCLDVIEDRSWNNEKKGGCGLMLCPFKTSTKRTSNFDFFDNSKFESLWVQSRYNFSYICRSETLLNVTYNPLKAHQTDFLERLLSKNDNAICESVPITMMSDYNMNFFQTLERDNLETVFIHYGFSVAGPILSERICKTTKTHIDYNLTENIPVEKSFVFDSPSKTNHFGCALFTDITVENRSRIILHRFDKKKNDKLAFCKTLSGLSWFKIYQCSTPSDMFDMFVYVLSSAAENDAPSKKSSQRRKLRNF